MSPADSQDWSSHTARYQKTTDGCRRDSVELKKRSCTRCLTCFRKIFFSTLRVSAAPWPGRPTRGNVVPAPLMKTLLSPRIGRHRHRRGARVGGCGIPDRRLRPADRAGRQRPPTAVLFRRSGRPLRGARRESRGSPLVLAGRRRAGSRQGRRGGQRTSGGAGPSRRGRRGAGSSCRSPDRRRRRRGRAGTGGPPGTARRAGRSSGRRRVDRLPRAAPRRPLHRTAHPHRLARRRARPAVEPADRRRLCVVRGRGRARVSRSSSAGTTRSSPPTTSRPASSGGPTGGRLISGRRWAAPGRAPLRRGTPAGSTPSARRAGSCASTPPPAPRSGRGTSWTTPPRPT